MYISCDIKYNYLYIYTQQTLKQIIMTYLLKIYKTKNDKKHFITDIVETELLNHDLIESILIGKEYFKDSGKKYLMGVCRKSEVIRSF